MVHKAFLPIYRDTDKVKHILSTLTVNLFPKDTDRVVYVVLLQVKANILLKVSLSTRTRLMHIWEICFKQYNTTFWMYTLTKKMATGSQRFTWSSATCVWVLGPTPSPSWLNAPCYRESAKSTEKDRHQANSRHQVKTVVESWHQQQT